MVIISTSAIEVSIQAVSPELGVHFSSTAGVLPSAEAAAQAGGPAGAATVAGGATATGEAAGDGEAAGAAVVAGVAVGDGVCAMPGAPSPTSAAIANAGASPQRNLDSFIFWNSPEKKRSKRVVVFFAGADAHGRFERPDKDFAVADLPGAGRGDDGVDDFVGQRGRHRDLDLQLGQEADRVFRAAVNLGMPLLPSVTLDFRDRQAMHADGGQRVADLLEFERLNHRHYDFHVDAPSKRRGGFDNRSGPNRAPRGWIGRRCARSAPVLTKAVPTRGLRREMRTQRRAGDGVSPPLQPAPKN